MLDYLLFEAAPNQPSSGFCRLTLPHWVNLYPGHPGHPFLSKPAQQWLQLTQAGDEKAEHYLSVMAQPGWIRKDVIIDCLERFSSPVYVVRYHLNDGTGKVCLYQSKDLEWNGLKDFTIYLMTLYSIIRRFGGLHYDPDLGCLNRPSAVDRFLDASCPSRFSHVR